MNTLKSLRAELAAVREDVANLCSKFVPYS